MKYKVGQKFRIKTLEEVKKDSPNDDWNEQFFESNANKIFTISEIDTHPVHAEHYEHEPDVTIYGKVEPDNGNIVINTRERDDVILKAANFIELEDNLFEI